MSYPRSVSTHPSNGLDMLDTLNTMPSILQNPSRTEFPIQPLRRSARLNPPNESKHLNLIDEHNLLPRIRRKRKRTHSCSPSPKRLRETSTVESENAEKQKDDLILSREVIERYITEVNEMNPLHAKTRARKRTHTPSASSDRRSTDERSISYQHPSYEIVLAGQNTYLTEHGDGMANESRMMLQTLKNTPHTTPRDTYFSDRCHQEISFEMRTANEAKVLKHLTPLIVPSPIRLVYLENKTYKFLIDSDNDAWTDSIPVIKPRPQPDITVGFRQEAFTDEQFNKLQHFIGGIRAPSYFKATWNMFFPFFTAEVKAGSGDLEAADRQNAASMLLAVGGVVKLFRLVQREKQLHGQILGFSVSHDHRNVRAYAHYPVIEGEKTSIYRHTIYDVILNTSEEEQVKFNVYKLGCNIFQIWAPTLRELIRSAIDALPDQLPSYISGSVDPILVASISQISGSQGAIDSIYSDGDTQGTSFTEEAEEELTTMLKSRKKTKVNVLNKSI